MTKDAFQQLLGREPKVAAIHAGLECGIIGEKVPGMDAVSYGPTITGAHSPNEQVSLYHIQLLTHMVSTETAAACVILQYASCFAC